MVQCVFQSEKYGSSTFHFFPFPQIFIVFFFIYYKKYTLDAGKNPLSLTKPKLKEIEKEMGMFT